MEQDTFKVAYKGKIGKEVRYRSCCYVGVSEMDDNVLVAMLQLH